LVHRKNIIVLIGKGSEGVVQSRNDNTLEYKNTITNRVNMEEHKQKNLRKKKDEEEEKEEEEEEEEEEDSIGSEDGECYSSDEEEKVIRFYREDDKYGCFSNYSRHSVVIDGVTWPTTEHYFQAQKFAGTPIEEKVRRAESPNAAKKMGNNRRNPLRKDWEDVKLQVMEKALIAKFQQHEDLCRILLATGNAILVEHTKNDSYWADGGDGSGKNMLGKLLMKVRDDLQDGSLLENLADNKNFQQKQQQRKTGKINEKEKGKGKGKAEESKKEKENQGLRLTVSKNGVKKLVVLKARDMTELTNAIKGKFRTKPARITTSEGKELTQTLLDTLPQNSTLTIQ
jgi:ribA/ribD-fused uncharacterized protein